MLQANAENPVVNVDFLYMTQQTMSGTHVVDTDPVFYI
jgi:hypothetical protein